MVNLVVSFSEELSVSSTMIGRLICLVVVRAVWILFSGVIPRTVMLVVLCILLNCWLTCSILLVVRGMLMSLCSWCTRLSAWIGRLVHLRAKVDSLVSVWVVRLTD